MRNSLVLCFLIIFLASCQKKEQVIEAENEVEDSVTPEALPMNVLALDDLNNFQANAGWQVVGALQSDFQKRLDVESQEGIGVLMSKPAEDGRTDPLQSNLEHGDFDLELEFYLPKDAEASLLFQGRYKIILNDSWGKAAPFCGDVGAFKSAVNACRAPGLWQSLTASFLAPRFDEKGNKIQNAQFQDITLNGMLLHKKLELEQPDVSALFKKESPTGPFVLASKEGTVGFKNIHYKSYGKEALKLENIQYNLYQGDWDKLPNFDTLQVVRSGSLDFLDVSVAGQPDKYALKFIGDLYVPVEGDYFFETSIDDGGDLIIDSVLVLHNDGEPNEGTERTIAHLTAGKHDFEMTYFQDHWGASLVIEYEGPGIARQTLATNNPSASSSGPPAMPLDNFEKPELLRCFANYKGEKRTHVIAVGHPDGVHFLYDLEEAALLSAWRGLFSDVAKMWHGRGATQLMEPGNAKIELTDQLPVARVDISQSKWPKYQPSNFNFKGYELAEAGHPIFKYQLHGVDFQDFSIPSADKNALVRSVSTSDQSAGEGFWCRMAKGDQITQLSNGYYCVDGSYYLKILNAPETMIKDGKELVASLASGSIQYEILW